MEYSVVVLPEPVGPVTRMMPLGWLDHLVPALLVLLAEAEFLEVLHDHVGVENAHHQLFAEGGGHGGQAQFDFLARRACGS